MEKTEYFPWMKTVYKEFSKTFPADYDAATLELLHKNLEDEYQRTLNAEDYKSLKKLFSCVRYLYNHFCWKINWMKECSHMKISCVKILSYLIKIGILLSKSKPAKWIHRILAAMQIFPGTFDLLCDALLLLTSLKKSCHQTFALILKHFLFTNHLDVRDPSDYFKTLLLLRRLKFLTKDKLEKAKIVSYAVRIHRPPHTLPWLIAHGICSLPNMSNKMLVKRILSNKLKSKFFKQLRKVLLRESYSDTFFKGGCVVANDDDFVIDTAMTIGSDLEESTAPGPSNKVVPEKNESRIATIELSTNETESDYFYPKKKRRKLAQKTHPTELNRELQGSVTPENRHELRESSEARSFFKDSSSIPHAAVSECSYTESEKIRKRGRKNKRKSNKNIENDSILQIGSVTKHFNCSDEINNDCNVSNQSYKKIKNRKSEYIEISSAIDDKVSSITEVSSITVSPKELFVIDSTPNVDHEYGTEKVNYYVPYNGNSEESFTSVINSPKRQFMESVGLHSTNYVKVNQSLKLDSSTDEILHENSTNSSKKNKSSEKSHPNSENVYKICSTIISKQTSPLCSDNSKPENDILVEKKIFDHVDENVSNIQDKLCSQQEANETENDKLNAESLLPSNNQKEKKYSNEEHTIGVPEELVDRMVPPEKDLSNPKLAISIDRNLHPLDLKTLNSELLVSNIVLNNAIPDRDLRFDTEMNGQRVDLMKEKQTSYVNFPPKELVHKEDTSLQIESQLSVIKTISPDVHSLFSHQRKEESCEFENSSKEKFLDAELKHPEMTANNTFKSNEDVTIEQDTLKELPNISPDSHLIFSHQSKDKKSCENENSSKEKRLDSELKRPEMTANDILKSNENVTIEQDTFKELTNILPDAHLIFPHQSKDKKSSEIENSSKENLLDTELKHPEITANDICKSNKDVTIEQDQIKELTNNPCGQMNTNNQLDETFVEVKTSTDSNASLDRILASDKTLVDTPFHKEVDLTNIQLPNRDIFVNSPTSNKETQSLKAIGQNRDINKKVISQTIVNINDTKDSLSLTLEEFEIESINQKTLKPETTAVENVNILKCNENVTIEQDTLKELTNNPCDQINSNDQLYETLVEKVKNSTDADTLLDRVLGSEETLVDTLFHKEVALTDRGILINSPSSSKEILSLKAIGQNLDISKEKIIQTIENINDSKDSVNLTLEEFPLESIEQKTLDPESTASKIVSQQGKLSCLNSSGVTECNKKEGVGILDGYIESVLHKLVGKVAKRMDNEQERSSFESIREKIFREDLTPLKSSPGKMSAQYLKSLFSSEKVASCLTFSDVSSNRLLNDGKTDGSCLSSGLINKDFSLYRDTLLEIKDNMSDSLASEFESAEHGSMESETESFDYRIDSDQSSVCSETYIEETATPEKVTLCNASSALSDIENLEDSLQNNGVGDQLPLREIPKPIQTFSIEEAEKLVLSQPTLVVNVGKRCDDKETYGEETATPEKMTLCAATSALSDIENLEDSILNNGEDAQLPLQEIPKLIETFPIEDAEKLVLSQPTLMVNVGKRCDDKGFVYEETGSGVYEKSSNIMTIKSKKDTLEETDSEFTKITKSNVIIGENKENETQCTEKPTDLISPKGLFIHQLMDFSQHETFEKSKLDSSENICNRVEQPTISLNSNQPIQTDVCSPELPDSVSDTLKYGETDKSTVRMKEISIRRKPCVDILSPTLTENLTQPIRMSLRKRHSAQLKEAKSLNSSKNSVLSRSSKRLKRNNSNLNLSSDLSQLSLYSPSSKKTLKFKAIGELKEEISKEPIFETKELRSKSSQSDCLSSSPQFKSSEGYNLRERRSLVLPGKLKICKDIK